MSSQLSSPFPADDVVEAALRETVQEYFQRGEGDNVAVNNVRAAVEAQLELPAASLKNDAHWKNQSRAIVEDEFTKLSHLQSDAEGRRSELSFHPGPAAPQKKRKRQAAVTQARKRSSPTPEPDLELPSPEPPPVIDVSETERNPASARKVRGVSRKGSTRKKPTKHAKEEDRAPVDNCEGHGDGNASDKEPVVDRADNNDADHGPGSESEMSVVIDDEPARKPKRNSSTTAKPRKSSGTAKKSRQPKDAPAPTGGGGGGGDAEIDRLRSWLVKCGIRKKWSKELAPYDTPRAKINHLRQMLSEVGMTGRFSADKARRIREERELNAEVQAVQESAQAWSKRASRRGGNDSDEKEEAASEDDDEEEENHGISKHRKARNVATFRNQYLALLDSEEDDGDNWRPS